MARSFTKNDAIRITAEHSRLLEELQSIGNCTDLYKENVKKACQ